MNNTISHATGGFHKDSRKVRFFPVQKFIGFIFVITIVAALTGRPFSTATAATDGGSTPEDSNITLPKAFGQPRSLSVINAFGAVSDQIPIVVPSGRHGVEPNLSLTYNSMGGSGIAGLGWSLETGFVEVWRGDGIPSVGNVDSYLYHLAGSGGQLVNTGNGVYRAQIENIYREFHQNEANGSWEMYNGEGALHRFGGTPDSRIEGQQWMLDLVQDPHGNTITYTYQRLGNILYIDEIHYTGYAPTGDTGANLITFEYENRDDARIGYGYSVREERNQRLKRVSIYAGNQLARRYEFVYENNPLNGLSLLKQIVLVGADDSSRFTLRNLEYSTRTLGWNTVIQPSWPEDVNGSSFVVVDAVGASTGVQLLDVNGDGFTDLLTNNGEVYLGIGNGNFDPQPAATWTSSLQEANVQFVIPSGELKGIQTGVNLLDVNSDGLPDLFFAQDNRRQIYLNTGEGWSYTEPVQSGEESTTGEQWSVGNFGLESISAQAVYSNVIYVTSPGVYDDLFAGWTYSGGWVVDSSAFGAYQNSLHNSSATDSSASITFQGRKFALIYSAGASNGELEISVDGVLVENLDQSGAAEEWQKKWISPLFAPGVHTIVMKPVSGEIVNIDAIEIDGDLPGAISDLAVELGEEEGSAVLSWSAPGNDGDQRRAASYQARYSSSAILTEDDWLAAINIEVGLPMPGVPGATDSMTISGLTTGETVYFSVRALDGVENHGGVSNSPSIQIPASENSNAEEITQQMAMQVDDVEAYQEDINNVSDATFLEPFALVGLHGESKGVQLADVNADGRVDIIWSFSRTPTSLDLPLCDEQNYQCEWLTQVRGVFLNTGKGWMFDPTLSEALKSIDFFVKDTEWVGYDFMEVNGDGLIDIVRTIASKPIELLLGTGSGWVPDDSGYLESLVDNQIISLDSNYKGQGLVPTDFNDDGLVDYLQANSNSTRALANTGSGWVEAPEMADILTSEGIVFSSPEGKSTGTLMTDINGDGLLDFVKARGGEPVEVLLSGGLRSGNLIRATSGFGEITELTWTTSTQFDNRQENGIQGLPIPIAVVHSLVRKDGRGGIYTYIYEYGGGWYTGRQFRGFRSNRETLPSGLIREVIYHQEEGLVGQSKAVSDYDQQNFLRHQTSSLYEVTEDAVIGIQQVGVTHTEELWNDPGGFRRSAVTYTRDAYLNITAVLRDTDTNITGDESTTLFTWAANLPAGFWSMISRVTTLGPGGSVIRDHLTLYDGLPEGQVQFGAANEIRDLLTPGKFATKSIEYDAYGNVVLIRDPENNVTQFSYDETATFLDTSFDAENRVDRSKSDPRFGAVIWEKNAAGSVETRDYDAFGRLVRVVIPGDEVSPFGTQTIEYSPVGDATTQSYTVRKTESAGQPGTIDTTYYFNGMGKIYRVEGEGSGSRPVVVTTEFDDADNPVITSRPYFAGDTPLLTVYQRDELHRPTRVTVAGMGETNITYVGARAEIVDPRGMRSSFYRDADGNITAVHQWLEDRDLVTTFEYDVLGQLTGVTDALGEHTRISYDLAGRRTRLEDPNTGSFQYEYDNNGQLTQQIGPDGKVTSFGYNRAGDLISKRFPDGSSQTFTYDSTGRLSQANDAAGTLKIDYDARGNVTERRRNIEGKTYTTQYGYDSLNRILKATYPDGFTVFYSYDKAGNLVSMKDNSKRVIVEGMTYTASGQLLGIKYGNGVNSSYTYDELMRMTNINTSTAAGKPLQKLAYTYDSASDILSIIDSVTGTAQNFEYDSLGRLTQAVGPYGKENYIYDDIGNMLQKGNMVFTIEAQHPQRVICVVDQSLVTNNPCQSLAEQSSIKTSPQITPNSAGMFTIVYDEYGNAVQKGETKYEYDFENNLIRVRNAAGKVLAENFYDTGGQRVVQRNLDGSTIYIDGIYEESRAFRSHHVMAGPLLVATMVVPRSVADSNGSIPANTYNSLAGLAGFVFLLVWMPFQRTRGRKWFAGLGLLREAYRVNRHTLIVILFLLAAIISMGAAPDVGGQSSAALKATEKYYYYHSNHLGSTNAITDQKGAVVEQRDYKPYGDVYQTEGAISGPREFERTFDGQTYDDATGLYYMGARHYDPQLGRFLSADTQVPDPSNPKALNRYAFASGNPIRYVDPTGHDVAWWDIVLSILVIASLVALAGFTLGFGIGVLSAAGIIASVTATWGFFGALLLTGIVAGAFIGGAVFASVALARGQTPAGGTDFWASIGSGAIIGAVIGGALALIPYSLGCLGAGFWFGLITGTIVGAVLGGGASVATYLHTGNPGSILQDGLGLIAQGAIKGAAIGAIVGAVLGVVALVGASVIQVQWGCTIIGGVFTGESVVEIGWNVINGANNLSLSNFFGTWNGFDESVASWFRNSPLQTIGVPSWALSGSMSGMSTSTFASQLQTMPFAP